MRVSSLSFLLFFLAGIAGFAYANGAVTGEIQAFIVSTNDEGEEKITLTSEAVPGQVMEFQIVFTNNGDSDVSGIKVVDPIPQNTRYIEKSHDADVAAAFEVSIDGGETFESEPVLRIETQADGTQKQVVVPPEQYTHVRWVTEQGLPSKGGSHKYSYRVAVE